VYGVWRKGGYIYIGVGGRWSGTEYEFSNYFYCGHYGQTMKILNFHGRKRIITLTQNFILKSNLFININLEKCYGECFSHSL